MPKYEVIATNYGLNLNGEFFTDTALASFPAAFPEGQPSHFLHASEQLPYPPLIGVTVGTPVVDATKAIAVIDFTDHFARNFEEITNNTYDVSIYSMATWHWDDECTQVIDELLYSPDNAIDVVMYGAAKEAKVTKKVEDRVKDGVNSGETQGFVRFSSTMALKLMEEPKKEGKAMDKQVIKDALAEVITELKLADDDVSRIADAVAAIPPSVVELPAAEPEVDIQQVVADSLKAGAESGLTGKSIERVSNAVLKGDSIADAIANEKALIDEFKEQFKTEVVADGVHVYGSGNTPTGGSAADIANRIFAKKGV